MANQTKPFVHHDHGPVKGCCAWLSFVVALAMALLRSMFNSVKFSLRHPYNGILKLKLKDSMERQKLIAILSHVSGHKVLRASLASAERAHHGPGPGKSLLAGDQIPRFEVQSCAWTAHGLVGLHTYKGLVYTGPNMTKPSSKEGSQFNGFPTHHSECPSLFEEVKHFS